MKVEKPFISKDLADYQKTQLALLFPVKAEKMVAVLNDLNKKCEHASKDYMNCILAYFFGNISHKKGLEKLNLVGVPHKKCAKSISKADIMWTCVDCSKLGPCTCYCHTCFDLEKHKGHKYSYQIGTLGCCDCGDEAALNHNTFCENHSSTNNELNVTQLPEYYQVYGPIIWSNLVKGLHVRLCRISSEQLLNAPLNDISALAGVLLLLSNIFKITPLFYDFLANALQLYFPEHSTRHLCCLEDNNEGVVHPCTCSVLDNIMKFLLYLVEKKQISEFLSQLCKAHHNFGIAALKAFWKNYSYIIKLINKRRECFEFLNKIMWQVNLFNEDMIRNLPQFSGIYYKELETEVALIVKDPSHFDETKHIISFSLLFDYVHFFNKDGVLTRHLIKEGKFLPFFIKLIGKLQFSNNVPLLDRHITYEERGINLNITKAIDYFVKIFNHTLQYYGYDDNDINSEIFALLFREIDINRMIISNMGLVHNCNTPLFRILTIALCGFMQKTNTFEPKELLKRICELSKNKEEEIIKCLKWAIQRTIKGLVFIAEIEAGYWAYYGDAANQLLKFFEDEKRYELIYADIALIQLGLAMIPESEIELYEWFDFKNIFSTQKSGDPAKQKKFLEKIVLYISQCTYNDLALPGLLLKSSTNIHTTAPKDFLEVLLEYSLRKEMALTVLKEEEKFRLYEAMTLDQVNDSLSVFLNAKNTEKYILPLLEVNPAIKGRVAYRITTEANKYFNAFNITSTRGFVNADYNTRAMKKLPNIVLSPFEESFMLPFYININYQLKQKIVFSSEAIKESIRIIQKKEEVFKSEIVQIFALKTIYEVLANSKSCLLEKDMKKNLQKELQKTESEAATGYDHLIGRILEFLSVAHKSLAQQVEEQKHQKDPEEQKHQKDSRAQLIKEKQKKIAEEFLKKQQMFAMKNKENLNEVVISPHDSSLDCCSYCKEDTSKAIFSKKPYGYLCFLTTSGIYKKSYKDTANELMKRALPARISEPKSHIMPERCKIFHSCGHVMHLACFESFYKSGACKIYKCPLCKNPFNSLLPSLEDIIDVPGLNTSIYAFYEPFRQDPIAEEQPLGNVLMQFMDLICSMIFLIDLINLNQALVTKQKYFKCCMECILKVLNLNSCSIISRQFDDSIKISTRTLPLSNQARLVCYKTFSFLFSAYAKNRTIPEAFSIFFSTTVLNATYIFLLQSALKYYLLTNNNELDREIPSGIRIGLLTAFDTCRTQIESDLINFFKRMIFIKSVIEKWDYTCTSFDNIRNVIIGLSSPNESTLGRLYKILGITVDPFAILKQKVLEDGAIPSYTKNFKVVEFLKKFGFPHDKQISPDADFFMQTTPISFELIPLPDNYADVFQKYYPLSCQHCGKSEQSKCLCLLCGKIICANSPCCKFSIQKDSAPSESIGELTYHTISCCGGSGIFLYLYHAIIIIQSDKLGVQTSLFYYNQFGNNITSYCKNKGLPFDSIEFSKYHCNALKYQALRDMLAMGKEKYEIWQEINKGSTVIRGNV